MPDNLRFLFRRGMFGKGRGMHGFGALKHLRKPRHTFELLADGTIEVRIRRGDSELVQRFDSEDDLADRRPKLYDKFLDLTDVDREEE